jgi:hypothetical protein
MNLFKNIFIFAIFFGFSIAYGSADPEAPDVKKFAIYAWPSEEATFLSEKFRRLDSKALFDARIKTKYGEGVLAKLPLIINIADVGRIRLFELQENSTLGDLAEFFKNLGYALRPVGTFRGKMAHNPTTVLNTLDVSHVDELIHIAGVLRVVAEKDQGTYIKKHAEAKNQLKQDLDELLKIADIEARPRMPARR